MGKRCYIGNLPYKSCTDEALRELFAPRNIVEVKIINDRETHRPRGFAFVEFATDAEAADAIEQFNCMVIDGREIVVNEARQRETRGADPSSDGQRRGARGGRDGARNGRERDYDRGWKG